MKNPHKRLRRKRNLRRRRRRLKRRRQREYRRLLEEMWGLSSKTIMTMRYGTVMMGSPPNLKPIGKGSGIIHHTAGPLPPGMYSARVRAVSGGRRWGRTLAAFAQIGMTASQAAAAFQRNFASINVIIEGDWEVEDQGLFVGHLEGYRLWTVETTYHQVAEEVVEAIVRAGMQEALEGLQQSRSTVRLGSVGRTGHTLDPSVREYVAICDNGMDHEVPDPNCGCGFWAMWDWSDLPWSGSHNQVVGKVLGYGKVIEYPPKEDGKGFRAEKIRIKEFYEVSPILRMQPSSRILNEISYLYGVPILSQMGESTWPED